MRVFWLPHPTNFKHNSNNQFNPQAPPNLPARHFSKPTALGSSVVPSAVTTPPPREQESLPKSGGLVHLLGSDFVRYLLSQLDNRHAYARARRRCPTGLFYLFTCSCRLRRAADDQVVRHGLRELAAAVDSRGSTTPMARVGRRYLTRLSYFSLRGFATPHAPHRRHRGILSINRINLRAVRQICGQASHCFGGDTRTEIPA
jgi:hypothetical protein